MQGSRHDNDRKLPRTTKEIYDLNRVMADRMESVFLSKGVPVVPSIGALLSVILRQTLYLTVRFILWSFVGNNDIWRELAHLVMS